MLSAPAPNATICSSPPAIITFLRKWIIWFWSAKLLWNASAVARENSASAVAAVRVWKPAISREAAAELHDNGDRQSQRRQR